MPIFDHFWDQKNQLAVDFWPIFEKFRKSVAILTKIAFAFALLTMTYAAIVTRPLFYS